MKKFDFTVCAKNRNNEMKNESITLLAVHFHCNQLMPYPVNFLSVLGHDL